MLLLPPHTDQSHEKATQAVQSGGAASRLSSEHSQLLAARAHSQAAAGSPSKQRAAAQAHAEHQAFHSSSQAHQVSHDTRATHRTLGLGSSHLAGCLPADVDSR
ncbi:hypothetical protein WJX72_003148 [[Myrmecia] bisecta]|uniref:Uncharacterized protein n=1 Tax=[Myrmecia] bisecta TaxID=41462 RepID=A0AAW1P362_9CHLO